MGRHSQHRLRTQDVVCQDVLHDDTNDEHHTNENHHNAGDDHRDDDHRRAEDDSSHNLHAGHHHDAAHDHGGGEGDDYGGGDDDDRRHGRSREERIRRRLESRLFQSAQPFGCSSPYLDDAPLDDLDLDDAGADFDNDAGGIIGDPERHHQEPLPWEDRSRRAWAGVHRGCGVESSRRACDRCESLGGCSHATHGRAGVLRGRMRGRRGLRRQAVYVSSDAGAEAQVHRGSLRGPLRLQRGVLSGSDGTEQRPLEMQRLLLRCDQRLWRGLCGDRHSGGKHPCLALDAPPKH
mmetsp:Transcript_56301/g.161576  ORF Transcript_56301/g.161576 Transcript_56301/m.161576 type:complete len:292 (+) Transcript_56301:471-1346(+)